jgi:transitional endoplasmic reticulum ATPase
LSAYFLGAVREFVAAGKGAIICTTSRPESIDPALRTPGTLDHELAIPLPDRGQRLKVLQALSKTVPLDNDVALDDVAGRTPGFVAADLLALLKEAALRAASRQQQTLEPTVSMADFTAALDVVRPTSMGSATLDIAKITLDEVGDMAEVKQAVTETVLWPLQYPDTFEKLGGAAPHGLLLYGPPGCGKTYLVKAIAGSGQANVLSVKGAELLSKWVGESEKAVRELFRRAREAAPTLVFLDEVDALAPTRGQSTDGGTTDRVVAALLTELDGVESLHDVVVIGATNRPDLIDPALLRPGRLEKLVYVPPPDAAARAAILTAAVKKVPLAPGIDLADLGRRTEGFSAADCAALIREAALCAMRESMEAATVTVAHVEAALASVRPSLDPAQVAALQAYAERRDTR